MNKIKKIGITSFGLHLIAAAAMLIDHISYTLMPQKIWMRAIGRLSFPIFAFMIVEGYYHTRDVKKYMTRLLIFALISEIPFNLTASFNIFNPLAQNAIWTFLISLSTIVFIEKISKKYAGSNPVPAFIFKALAVITSFILGTVTFVDYMGPGVLMVLTFYFFREKTVKAFIPKLILMILINVVFLRPFSPPLAYIGSLEIPMQTLALLSLPVIHFYNGEKGYSSKFTKYFFYLFYPVHLLILAAIIIAVYGFSF